MRTSNLSTLLLGLFSSLAIAAVCPAPPTYTPPPVDDGLSNTEPFTLIAKNASYPDIDGLSVWTQSGISYLNRGVQNPRFSYPISAKLENNKLIRIPVPSDPGAANTAGNLNFGTSNVCCSYAQLRWSDPSTLPIPGVRVDPFFVDARGNLVFERAPYRQPWYVCGKTKLPGTKGEERILYLGLPFYEFQGKPEEYCVAVELAILRPL